MSVITVVISIGGSLLTAASIVWKGASLIGGLRIEIAELRGRLRSAEERLASLDRRRRVDDYRRGRESK